MSHRPGVYEYAVSLTSQFYFCGMPFRLDSSAKCSLNCNYCFAMSRGGRRTRAHLTADPKTVARKLHAAFNGGRMPGHSQELLQHRMPVHFGGISDPFASKRVTRITNRILSSLAEYDYPVVISTKKPRQLLEPSTAKILMSLSHVAVQVSIPTIKTKMAQAMEPLVDSPMERIKTLRDLAGTGIHCICRVQPVLIPDIHSVADQLIPQLAEAGCKHVLTEFLKLPVERDSRHFMKMLAALRWDAAAAYKSMGAHCIGREWLLPSEVKLQIIAPVVAAIRSHGMSYGAADYGLHHLGDTSCCCGLDGLPGFENWFTGNFANVIRESDADWLTVTALDRHWYPNSGIDRVLNSNCRIPGKDQSVFAYLKAKWNQPGSPNAPDSFLGVQWSGDYDEEGNCVYHACHRGWH